MLGATVVMALFISIGALFVFKTRRVVNFNATWYRALRYPWDAKYVKTLDADFSKPLPKEGTTPLREFMYGGEQSKAAIRFTRGIGVVFMVFAPLWTIGYILQNT